MPAPYSDNLYSAADSSDDEVDALSPTDGYFHASSQYDNTSSSSHPFQHSIPDVPRRYDVLVEDPTLTGQADKAREAEAEAERAHLNRDDTGVVSGVSVFDRYPPSTRTSPTSPSSHSYRRSVDEDHDSRPSSIGQVISPHSNQPSAINSPIFPHHREAPPAYTPSPILPPRLGYQTFGPSNSTMGLPEEQQRLIPRPPESMGDHPNLPTPSRWQRFKEARRSGAWKKKVKSILGVLVVLSVISALFGSFTIQSNRRNPDIIDNEPVKRPNMDHSDLTWKPHPGCLNSHLRTFKTSVSAELHYTRNLSIIQTIEKTDPPVSGWSPHVFGEVILRPLERDSTGNIDVEVIYNGNNLDSQIKFEKQRQELRIITPRKVEWDSSTSDGPCIQIRITVWVPREAIINQFSVDTVHLDVLVNEGLVLGALNPVSIRTVIGDVRTPLAKDNAKKDDLVLPYRLSTREIYLSTVSGDILGWYPLYDVLEAKSDSGEIKIDIGPKPANPEGAQPAVLRARSLSGDLVITEPIDSAVAATRPEKKFPPRDYVVDLSTASGEISAKVAVSSLAEVSSQSGDLNLYLWPILDSQLLMRDGEAKEPSIKTDTKSGESRVTVLEPLWTSLATIGEVIPPLKPEDLTADDGEPYLVPNKNGKVVDDFSIAETPGFSVLTSKHTSISGDIKLVYPSSWEGKLSASTISGSQKFRGKGLQITHDQNRPWGKKTRGSKGKGHSELEIESVSGDEDFLVGEE